MNFSETKSGSSPIISAQESGFGFDPSVTMISFLSNSWMKGQINEIALYSPLSEFQDELYVSQLSERLLSLGRSISNMT